MLRRFREPTPTVRVHQTVPRDRTSGGTPWNMRLRPTPSSSPVTINWESVDEGGGPGRLLSEEDSVSAIGPVHRSVAVDRARFVAPWPRSRNTPASRCRPRRWPFLLGHEIEPSARSWTWPRKFLQPRRPGDGAALWKAQGSTNFRLWRPSRSGSGNGWLKRIPWRQPCRGVGDSARCYRRRSRALAGESPPEVAGLYRGLRMSRPPEWESQPPAKIRTDSRVTPRPLTPYLPPRR